MADTGTNMDDTLGVLVEQGIDEEEETFAEVADPFTRSRVQDPVVEAFVRDELTDCVVILTAL